MDHPEPCQTASNFFHINLGASTAEKESDFKGLPSERYTLQIWESIFQVIEAEFSMKPMLSPEGINMEKG